MKGHFLILSYPRSRTAWLANFLFYGEVFCGHEMLAECHRPAQWMDRLPAQYHYAGSAETVGAMIADQLFIPGLRIAIIWRDPREIVRSLRAIDQGAGLEMCEQMAPCLARAAKLPGARVFRYDQIGSPAISQAILEHVAPGEPFHLERWKMLNDFNVQITAERWSELESLATRNAATLLSKQ